MKYSFIAALTATLASASIIPRDLSAEQNQTLSQYPNTTDFGSLNGTWYLTAITDSAWQIYQSMSQSAGYDIDCLQFNITASSNTTLDVLGSAFLNNTKTAMGVNATGAGILLLQDPDSSTNTSDHQYYWDAYGSQVFVNQAAWDNFTSNGQSNANVSTSGSKAIDGTKPFEMSLYSKLIDSNSQPGSNDSTSFDTIFLWGSQVKFFELNQIQKRADQIFGVVLSKSSSINDDTLNKTVSLLPPSIAANNVSLIKLNDTCHS